MQDLLSELQAALQAEIPLSKAIGIRVSGYEEGVLALSAPLGPNVNHQCNAFAGSLAAVVTLSGWGLLWLLLREERLHAQIVIQDCAIAYLRPVTRDFTACCAAPELEQSARFLETLCRRGRARIELTAEIAEDGQPAVTFTGRYAAQLG
jgi:thioesterase domain-containing protein